MNRTAVFLLLLTALAVAAPVPNANDPEIDIRDPDGTVLLAASALTRYDWVSHTLTLKEGTRGPFLQALVEAGRFTVCVDGMQVMNGAAVPVSPTTAYYEPVIVLVDETTETGGEETVIISKGFGGPIAHKQTRDVEELKEALRKAGKRKTAK